MTSAVDVLIVGAGTAATMLIHRLAQHGAAWRVTVADPAARVPSTVAWHAARTEHLLNVRAGNMGIDANRPGEFAAFAQARLGRPLTDEFLPRPLYAQYLDQCWAEAAALLLAHGGALDHWPVWVQSIERDGHQLRAMANGEHRSARAVVLCAGTGESVADARAFALSAEQLRQAEAISPRAQVIGSGLTAVDVVLSLVKLGWRGPIDVYSRSGRWPLAHPPTALAASEWRVQPSTRARSLVGQVRAAMAQPEVDPRAVIDGLRSHTRDLWLQLPALEQRRLQRHVLGAFARIRHRMAPQVHAQLAALSATGQLRLHRARAHQVPALPAGSLKIEACGQRALPALTGLTRALTTAGLAHEAASARGLAATLDGRLSEAADPPLYAIGALLSGHWLESTAVPELRAQAATVAARLARELPIAAA